MPQRYVTHRTHRNSSGAIGSIWALVNASSDLRETQVTESSGSRETFGGDTQDDVGTTSSLARTSLPLHASPLCFKSQGPFCGHIPPE
ncbi:hypothetical protein BJ912DRAFT_1062255 [Pholiota molesta]|nr:hypothetical protein BJ912DRAFT_1062255 [Pholiota molesta]